MSQLTAIAQGSRHVPGSGPPLNGFLARLGRFVARYRWLVLTLTVVAAIAAGVLGAGAADRMSSGGLTDPGAESSQAARLLADRFAGGPPQLILLAEATGSVDAPEATAAAQLLVGRVASFDGVDQVESYWTSGRPATLRWYLIATAVMRRPILVTLGAVVLLSALAAPFAHASFGLIDHRSLPASASAHQATETMLTRFDTREATATSIILNGQTGNAALDRYAREISRLPHVARVDTLTGHYSGGRMTARTDQASVRFRGADGSAWLSVVTDTDPNSAAATRLIGTLRNLAAPAPALLGGPSATLVDTRDGIAAKLPWAALIVLSATGLLLFALTGSILIPVKAVVLTALSLTASFGAMVYVFQDGNLRWLVGDFVVTGTLDVTAPVLMFAVAYGLAMDYEIFLIARIQEEYDRTGDNTAAVATGLQRTGRLVTAAALLIAVVLGALATSGITYLKLLGVGLALAVLVDAFIVRALLVPALMRLAGQANWWAPKPLRRLHQRFGLRH